MELYIQYFLLRNYLSNICKQNEQYPFTEAPILKHNAIRRLNEGISFRLYISNYFPLYLKYEFILETNVFRSLFYHFHSISLFIIYNMLEVKLISLDQKFITIWVTCRAKVNRTSSGPSFRMTESLFVHNKPLFLKSKLIKTKIKNRNT